MSELLITLLAAYGAILLLVYVFQSRLVYFPEIGREIAVTPRAYGLDFEPAEIKTVDGETLYAWWVPAPDARGTVLLLHGNAGNISHRLEYLLMFRRLHYSTLIVDYRGYGRSTGSPSEEGTYRDAEAAWNYLVKTRAVNPADIVIFGESLGGAVAAWLAARVAPRAVVLASTFTSAPDLGAQVYPFLPVRLISRFKYDTLDSLGRVRAPVLVAHSRDDDIVPFAHGRKLYAAANEPRQFLEMRGGHNDGFVFMREEWVKVLAGFLERHARP